MELSTETSNTQKAADPTTTIVYATSIRSTVKPSTTTSVAEPSSVSRSNSKIEISDRFSKVLNMNNRNLKILDESSEQSDTKSERKQLRGNALRRQLPNDQSENFETHSQVVYSQSSDEDSDSVHTYSGVTGTQRPVFSTTSSPRIPALVLAARNRAAMLKNAALQTSVTTEKVYSKPPRRKSDRREENTSTTEQSAENEYLTQSPVAVQIPANRDATQNDNIAHVYRHQNGYLPRPREYLRQSQSSNALENNNNNNINNNNNNNIGPRSYKQVQSVYVQNDAENEQYLRETSESSVKGSTASTPEHYTNSDLNAATQPILQSYHPRSQRVYGAQPGLRPTNVNEYDQRLQQVKQNKIKRDFIQFFLDFDCMLYYQHFGFMFILLISLFKQLHTQTHTQKFGVKIKLFSSLLFFNFFLFLFCSIFIFNSFSDEVATIDSITSATWLPTILRWPSSTSIL